jgi:two-component system, NtrC family, response regulator PilR
LHSTALRWCEATFPLCVGVQRSFDLLGELLNHMDSILLADDDRFVREDVAELLRPLGFRILQSATSADTFKCVVDSSPIIVLLDIRFPDSDDLSLLSRIRATSPSTIVIVLSSQSEDVGQIVAAIKMGAYDYVPKPFIHEELFNRVQNAIQLFELNRANKQLLKEREERDGPQKLVGTSAEITSVREMIRKLADAETSVLIHGESGTGKELASRALHFLSRRNSSPFVVVNCAAIPEALTESVLFGHRRGAFTGAIETTKGKFEIAESGTIFLDEIGDMPIYW